MLNPRVSLRAGSTSWLIWWPWKRVPEGHVGAIFKYGELAGEIGPGDIQLINRITTSMKVVDLRYTKLDLPVTEYRVGNAIISARAEVCYHVKGVKNFLSVNDVEETIDMIVFGCVSRKISEKSADEAMEYLTVEELASKELSPGIIIQKNLDEIGVHLDYLSFRCVREQPIKPVIRWF